MDLFKYFAQALKNYHTSRRYRNRETLLDLELGICRLPSAPVFASQVVLDDIDGLAGLQGPQVF